MKFDNRVRLAVNFAKRAVIQDRDGLQLLTADRLCVLFSLPFAKTWHEAWFDTGACLTVFPESVWKAHEDRIEWVQAPAKASLPMWLQTASGIGGGAFRSDLARIQVSFFDSQVRCLRPRDLFVKCVHDGGSMPKPLIGLGGGTLDHRQLGIEYSSGEAWLSDHDLLER